MSEEKRISRRKSRVGKVISDKMEKTIVIAVETYRKHKLYGKRVKYTKKFKVHDQENVAKTGDVVKVMETRPLSKDKCWRLLEVVREQKLL